MEAIWKRGDLVYLTDTGEKALFEAYAELEGYAYVLTTDGGEVLVHIDDLGSPESTDSLLSENISGKVAEAPSKPSVDEKGLWMVLIPEFEQEEKFGYLGIWVCSTDQGLVEINAEMEVHGDTVFEEDFLLADNDAYFLCELYREDLGSYTALRFKLEFAGPSAEISEKRIKLNPQRLLKCFEGHQKTQVLIFDNEVLDKTKGGSNAPILEFKPPKKKSEQKYRTLSTLDPLQRAQFNSFIDLHIEALKSECSKLHARDILRIQLQAANDFVDRAFQSGMNEIYLIHGLGTGRLRDKIHEMLRHRSEVLSFANEYHPRYGWGATVVRFRS